MDKELEDEETRNWVKICLALRCLTKSLITFVQKKSEEQHSSNVTFLKKFVGVTDYSCSICNLETLEPYHSQRKPCKYSHVKYKCACSASGKQQCPEKTCGKLYDLIKDEHVENNPNWLNSKSELWSDKQRGPWERMKCFIDTHGYKKKSDISLADITALVQICTNNANMQREFGAYIKYLHKIRSIRNEVSHASSLKIQTCSFKEYILDVKNALLLQCFDQYRSTDQLEYLDSLEKDEQTITVEDEIGAREETLVAVKELIISLEEQLEQIQTLNDANSKASTEDIKEEIALLTSIEGQHFRQLRERFNQIEGHLKNIQNEYMKTKEKLSKHKSKLDCIEWTLELHTTELSNISKGVASLTTDIKPVLQKIAGNYEVLERLERKFDEFGSKLNRVDVPGMKLLVELKTSSGTEELSEFLVESTNGIGRDRVLTELQKCIQTALRQICKDGVNINCVKNECMAIYFGYLNLKSWLTFIHKYMNREFDRIFLSVENHLRAYIGYDDLELNVVIYEEDFTISVQSIAFQLDAQLTDVATFTEHVETQMDNICNSHEETPHRVESEVFADEFYAQENRVESEVFADEFYAQERTNRLPSYKRNKQSTINKGSDVFQDFLCSTCEYKKMAEFYCGSCVKFYCGNCIFIHSQLFIKHAPVGRGDMKKWPVAKKVEDILLKCDVHKEENLKMFCNDHRELCCSYCVLLFHRKCDNVTLISQVKSQSADLSVSIQIILEEMKKLQDKQEARFWSVQSSYDEQLNMIQETRNKIDAALNMIERNTRTEMKDIHTKLQASYKSDVDECIRLRDGLKQLRDAIQDISDKNNRELSFIATRKCEKKIQQSETFLEKISLQVKNLRYSIIPKPKSHDFLTCLLQACRKLEARLS
ncbi:hypothetical protein DPMN_142333 [Dreissena polymorpha]|uniref:B box-type domain-containing protein n=1 Tax=Dreissena polymorpha TaxID=45954 RepID=A0A9D4GBG4_DREPO|nr:hypothetical protein DPMN_142333 [Dreissena polymorpha]